MQSTAYALKTSTEPLKTHEIYEKQKTDLAFSSHLSALRSGFIIRIQAASRAYLAKQVFPHSTSSDHLSRVFSAPSLACLARDARYARAEAALRVALSQCDTEPSPLVLQVRVMEKGLHAWNARAGRGYERVRKAEEALAAVRREEEGWGVERGSMSDLQREKWMGMKERDEALDMVEKIKALITELSADIKEGLKAPAKAKIGHSFSAKASEARPDSIALDDMPAQKAPILFSGRFPLPYLENLPRSRRSVEPLRLTPSQLHITCQRSSTLHSEPIARSPSTPSTTEPSTPRPTTPTTPTSTLDGYGAALIHTPLPPKSMAQYLVEMNDSDDSDAAPGSKRSRGHTRLPSYVGDLMDGLSEDRIGGETLDLDGAFEASTAPSNPMPPSPVIRSPAAIPLSPTPTKRRSNAFLGRPFSVPSPPSSVPSPRLKESRDSSSTPPETAATFEKLLQTLSSASTSSMPSSSTPSSPARYLKNPGRMGNIVQSVRKGMKRVVKLGE